MCMFSDYSFKCLLSGGHFGNQHKYCKVRSCSQLWQPVCKYELPPPKCQRCLMYTQIHKCTNTQMHKYTNTQLHKYINTNCQLHTQIQQIQSCKYEQPPPKCQLCQCLFCPQFCATAQFLIWQNALYQLMFYTCTDKVCVPHLILQLDKDVWGAH